jgi:hypothetical protein
VWVCVHTLSPLFQVHIHVNISIHFLEGDVTWKKWGSYPSRVTSNPRIFIIEPLSGFVVNLGVPLNEILQVPVSLDCALQIVATKLKCYSSLVSCRFIGILLLNLNRKIK